jgi:hypothetical protein
VVISAQGGRLNLIPGGGSSLAIEGTSKEGELNLVTGVTGVRLPEGGGLYLVTAEGVSRWAVGEVA